MIAIVGAGITGLSLAKLLQDRGLDFRLYEAQDRPGGNIGTLQEGPYTLETGPNSIRMNETFHHLVEDLGLRPDLRFSAPEAKKRFVLRGGRYKSMPLGPPSLLFGSFFTFKELRRILRERRIAPGNDPAESVDAFFRRRFGDVVADYLVGPFISGIYAGDPKALLLAEAFPQVLAWEREYGSVLRGFFKGRKKSPYKGIFSFQNGLGQLAEALGDRLGDQFVTGARLQGISKQQDAWKLDFGTSSVEAEQVVLALPSYAIAKLLAELDPAASQDLLQINYPPVSVVQAAYPRTAVRHRLDGFGALHNHLEESQGLGVIFSSSLFPGRCPADEVLLTTFVGGARHPERALVRDADLVAAVREDHGRFLGVEADPVFSKVIRWEKAIPQYDAAALPSRKHLAPFAAQGLHLAGNWTHGISVPSCLEKAQLLCEQLSLPPLGN